MVLVKDTARVLNWDLGLEYYASHYSSSTRFKRVGDKPRDPWRWPWP